MGFSIVDAVRAGLAAFTRRWRPMAGASLVFMLPTEIAYGILDVDRGWGDSFGFSEAVAILALTVGGGLAFIAASRAYRSDSALQAARWTAGRSLPVVVLTVGTCAAFLLGLVLLIVPGLILITRWSLAWSEYADTGSSWRHALRRSNELVRGRSWSMFGLVVGLSGSYLLIDFALWHAVRDATNSDFLAFGLAAAAGFIATLLQAAILFAVYERLRSAEESPT